MAATLHLLKLCVGSDSVEDLLAWRAAHPLDLPGGLNRHVTRMWPRREAELLDGGSLYWVMRGLITARQRIVGLEEFTREDGIRRCAILMDPEIIRVMPVRKRPFQGWRYLTADDAPADLPKGAARDETIPMGLERALADIGVV